MKPYEIFNKVYETYITQIQLNSDYIQTALCAEDILKNEKDGKISSILAVEDGVIIGDKLERIKEIFDKGVRLVTLTWNFENEIGFPSSDDAKSHKLGLKPFGIETVREMNKHGMIIDVSHLSEGGFYDVAKYSEKSFVASHSCARSLCDHRRNLTDDQLKVLGEKGGMVGVNFCSDFLRENSNYATIDDISRHVRYMVDKAGIESVGLGSDFDGIECELEFKDYSGYPKLIDNLSKYFTYDQMEKICFENALRIFRENIGK
jgi:membrane dipeptidase